MALSINEPITTHLQETKSFRKRMGSFEHCLHLDHLMIEVSSLAVLQEKSCTSSLARAVLPTTCQSELSESRMNAGEESLAGTVVVAAEILVRRNHLLLMVSDSHALRTPQFL